MTSRQIRQLLERSKVLHHPCDVDLLLFFYRHPRSLLTSDQLATFVGYGVSQIAASLEAFIAAGIIERSQNPTHYARMYRLVRGTPDGWVPSIVKVATTRRGRQDVMQALKEMRSTEDTASGSPPEARVMPPGERKVAYA
jgi:predicted transcriptional regulator